MMRVTHQRYAEAIGAALMLMPAGIRRRLENIDVLCNTDPGWAGLHSYRDCGDGYARSYATVAHAVYPMYQWALPKALRAPTIVIPALESPGVILHEFAHMLHEQLRFEPSPAPVSIYAGSNRYEAFACAFELWCAPGQYLDPRQCHPDALQHPEVLEADRATLGLFEFLAA